MLREDGKIEENARVNKRDVLLQVPAAGSFWGMAFEGRKVQQPSTELQEFVSRPPGKNEKNLRSWSNTCQPSPRILLRPSRDPALRETAAPKFL